MTHSISGERLKKRSPPSDLSDWRSFVLAAEAFHPAAAASRTIFVIAKNARAIGRSYKPLAPPASSNPFSTSSTTIKTENVLLGAIVPKLMFFLYSILDLVFCFLLTSAIVISLNRICRKCNNLLFIFLMTFFQNSDIQ